MISLYHSTKSSLLLAIFPVFCLADERKNSVHPTNGLIFAGFFAFTYCFVVFCLVVLVCVWFFFNCLLNTKYHGMTWLQSIEYPSPCNTQGVCGGRMLFYRMQLLVIKVKGCSLPLDNPEGTFEDLCYLWVSSEVHWLLHGSSYV